MAKLRIKKGDTVQVIAGPRTKTLADGTSIEGDRGKTGKVIAVYPDTQRVLVEGINRIKKHTKVGQTGRGSKTGGIITQEAPIHISNVQVVDPETDKPTRVGVRVETVERDGRTKRVRIRVAKRSGKDI
jgi:large subunit ribosomal protein L24